MFTLKSVTTRSGTTAELSKPGALCIVGGNNVGKSQLLRDLASLISRHRVAEPVVLEDIHFEVDSWNDADVERWFRDNSIRIADPTQGEMFQAPDGGAQMRMADLLGYARQPDPAVNQLASWFIENLDSGRRHSLASARLGSAGIMIGNAGNPLMQLFRDGDLERELSDLCKRTFGFGLTLDRANGDLMLRVGFPGIPSPSLQYPTLEYANAVAALTPLESQGDGVRNYLGMVLHMMTSRVGVTMIDEPEAFLHPAQARSLGRHLGTVAVENSRQLVTATHDRDFVIGLLESDVPVTFLRLNRSKADSAATLDVASVQDIWSRPELRYSNVLQGLFHRVAVVCEADADCRWYAAVLDGLALESGLPGEEALFLPAGGKSGVQNCVKVLRSLDVNCYAIVDFDVVLDVNQLAILLKNFDSAESDHEILRLCQSIVNSLDTSEKKASAKANGVAGLPRGDVQTMGTQVIDMLSNRRILAVPIGELECFDGTIGGKGAVWVTRALEKKAHLVCEEARKFVRPILDSVSPLLAED